MKRLANVIFVLIILASLSVFLLPIKALAATYNIAASNSSSGDKATATAVCTGTDDQNTINTYLTTGNTVHLYAGTYNINGLIILATGNTLYGQGNTSILNYQNNVGGIFIDGVSNVTIYSIEITGNADPSYGFIVGLGGTASQSNFYFHDIKNMSLGCDDFAIYSQGGTLSNISFVRCDANNPDGYGFIVNGAGSPSNVTNMVYYLCTVENAGVAVTRNNAYVTGFDLVEYAGLTVNHEYVIDCSVNGAWESDFHYEADPTKQDCVIVGSDAQYSGKSNGAPTYGAGYLVDGLADIIIYNNTGSHNWNSYNMRWWDGSIYHNVTSSPISQIFPSSSTKVTTAVSQGNCSGVIITTSANHYELVLYSSDGNAVSQTLTLPNLHTYSVSFSNYDVELGVVGSTTTATVSALATSNIADTTATLNGNLSNMGSETSVVVTFEYGFTTSYGFTATAAESPLTTTGNFHADITGLSMGTLYHFRVKAVGISTAYSADSQFTTTGTAGINPFLVINQISSDNYVIGSGKNDNKLINNYSSGGTTTTTTTTTSTTTTGTTTTPTPLIPTSTGSLIVKYLLPLAIIVVTIFMVFRYWKNPILLICYFIGLMLMLILALNFMNYL